eukprot:16427310-Heterocapsa_arctica.AAC.1
MNPISSTIPLLPLQHIKKVRLSVMNIRFGFKLEVTNYTEYAINARSDAYYHLRKTVDDHMYIYNRWYRSSKYMIGISTEMVPGSGFSGLNTKNGDLLTISFRGCDFAGDADSVPQKVFVALHYDAIINIKDSGAEAIKQA